MSRSVYASAPARIDFAGGTLDIYPLYLYFDGGLTINAAISLEAQVRLTERADDRITIQSLDTGAELACDAGLDNLPLDGKLSLITRLLRHYRPAGGIDVQTNLQTPHGSGLGASSTLIVTMAHALLAYNGLERDYAQIVRVSNNLEAQLMHLPAGLQDYYPPSYGSINAVHYGVEDTWLEPLDPEGKFLEELTKYIIVTSTNITHHSGTTNWTYMRNYFEGVARTVESFKRIKSSALHFYAAFKTHDIRLIARLLNEEWETRKGLSDEITTPEIDRMIDASNAAGAWANKLCGAGGGGCMVTMAPPEAHAQVIAALEANGATNLHARLVQRGIHVEVTDGDRLPV